MNFEKPFWEDPSEHLKRSPIMYVGNVKTPTLLMTGVLDLRTPMPQSEEFYRALKLRGIPTALIRVNNEYPRHVEHAVELPANAALPAKLVREVCEQAERRDHDDAGAVGASLVGVKEEGVHQADLDGLGG